MKYCQQCKETKPEVDFNKASQRKDGLQRMCRKCQKEYTLRTIERKHELARIHYIKNRDAIKKKSLEYARTVEGREKCRLRSLERSKKEPEKKHARFTLLNAVRDKRIKKQNCVICGRKAQAHHWNYSLPLDVFWLCPDHHFGIDGIHQNVKMMDKEAAKMWIEKNKIQEEVQWIF